MRVELSMLAAVGEKRHRAHSGRDRAKCLWHLPVALVAQGRGLPLTQPAATPQQPYVTLGGRWGSSIAAELRDNTLLDLSHIRGQHRCTDYRRESCAGMAPFTAPCSRNSPHVPPSSLRISAYHSRLSAYQQGYGHNIPPSTDTMSRGRTSKAVSTAQHKSP